MSDTTKRFGDLHPLLRSTIIETLKAEKAKSLVGDCRNAWSALAMTAAMSGIQRDDVESSMMATISEGVGGGVTAAALMAGQHIATAFDVAIAELERSVATQDPPTNPE